MFSWPMALALPLVLSALVPVDPGVHTDDFISVSCPRPDACLLLDRAGNLTFSTDAGRSLVPRAHLAELDLTRIRFAGLLNGWALDRSGRVWQTRDGGRRFTTACQPGALPHGELASALTLDPAGRPWLGTRSGRVYRLGTHGRLVRVGEGPFVPVVSVAASSDAAAAVYRSGTLLFLPGRDGSGPAQTSRPLKLRAAGVGFADAGRVVVAGCLGAVRWSADRGRSWRGPETGPESPICLTPAAQLPGGPMVLLGQEGGLALADLERGVLDRPVDPRGRRWNDAALVRSKLLLVGDGGSIAWFEQGADGGWGLSPVATGAPGVVDLFVSGRQKVYRAMSDGSLAMSPDGGQEWRALASAAEPVSRMVFTDAQHGFALVSGGDIAGTRDGGRSWESLGRWPDLKLADLAFIDAAFGWAVGEAGAIVRTADGGHSWALDRVPAFEAALSAVQFIDRKRGFAVGADQAVFRTRDGGSSWHRLRSGPGRLSSLFFFDARRGFVAGERGTLLFTRDAGETWEPRSIETDAPVAAIAFSDPLLGLAAAPGGHLWATMDGGRFWHPIEIHSRAEIVAVACLPRSRSCLVGGQRGLLLLGDPFNELIQ